MDPPVSMCAQNGKQLLTCWSLLAHCNVLFLLHTSPRVSEPSLSTKFKVALRLQLLTTQEHCHPGRNKHQLTKSPGPVFTRVKLLHNNPGRAVSTNCTCHKTPRGLISKDEPLLPAYEGNWCSARRTKNQMFASACRVCRTESHPELPSHSRSGCHLHGKSSPWFFHSSNAFLSV